MARYVALAISFLAAGCATSGIGSGELSAPGKPESEGMVQFAWDADVGAVGGDIRAVLPDGRAFVGRFLQVTSSTMTQQVGRYGASWGPWGTTGGGGGGMGLVTHYTGLMIATLEGPSGERMRCQFRLEDPPSGPASGGIGDCELSTGEAVRYAVLTGN